MTRSQTLQLIGLLALVILAGLATLWIRQQRTTATTRSATAVAPLPFSSQLSAQQPQTPTSATDSLFIEGVTLAPDHLNPVFTTNPTSLSIIRKLYPPLVGQDPESGMASLAGLAQGWSFDAGGRILTLTLYENLLWSDGQPLTAQDVRFTYAAIQDPTTASPYQPNFANITTVRAVDDRTVQLELATPDCTIFQTLHQPILPAHIYDGSLAQFQATEQATAPTVGAGPFTLVERIDDRIRLRSNPLYRAGAPLLAGWEVRIVDDPETQLSMLRAGELDLVRVDPENFARVTAMPTVRLYTALRDSLTFLALNLADPENPRPGQSAGGELITQAPHPILGDRQVRQALAHAVDYTALLEQVYGDGSVRLDSYLLPTIAWAHQAQLARYTYDPDAAIELLAAAGWLDSDGDGIRDRNGQRLELTLLTNGDSPSRLQLAQLLATELQTVGVAVEVQAENFEGLTDRLLNQRYDLVLIGWDNLGAEPANSDFWHSRQDEPGQGANFVSFQDPEVDQWLDEARSAPDCDGGYRTSRYRLVQARIHEALLYIVIGGHRQGWAYRTRWQEIAPQPWQFDYNVQRWWEIE